MSQRIVGIGIDMIEIARIARALKRPGFAARIYSDAERQYLAKKPAESWAARFAAKEAVMKALGCGWQKGIAFRHISITNDSLGKPQVALTAEARRWASAHGITELFISLSHTRDFAVAQAVAVREEDILCES